MRREAPDVPDLDFRQRFTGSLSEDGRRMEGRWEVSDDDGVTWETDFDLIHTRMT